MARPTAAIALALLGLGPLSCGARGRPAMPEYGSSITERPGPDGTLISSVDLDDDGRTDVHNTLRVVDGERQLLRKEVDLNRDGVIDQTSWYEHGELVKRETDEDFDDQIDRVEHYLGGARVLAESDLDHDGTTEEFRYFVDGYISRKERDTTGDGQVDTWEFFESGGVTRVGIDEDGDGVIDVRLE